MTGSRSPSPIHNLPPTNSTTDYTAPTNSRPHPTPTPVGEHFTNIPTADYRQPLTVRLSPPAAAAAAAPQEVVAESSRTGRRRRPTEEHTGEQPMAKRIRRASPQTRERRNSRSSPSSDSNDELADNETDNSRRLDRHEPLQPTFAPPKKKRTRTLTTPHQSAVLHALLAQSRFPTTAMREEVGRSIGLSARKVQIWFQNQRQKARRPRSQSDTPTRPPQYGPFPGASESVSRNIREFDDGMERGPYGGYSGRHSPEMGGGSSESSAPLLGPGMPGAPAYHLDASRYSDDRATVPLYRTDTWRPPSSGLMHHQRFPSPLPFSSQRMHPSIGARPATSQPSHWKERDPSRTLPPLVSTRPASSSYASRRTYDSSTGHTFFSSRPSFPPPRSVSPEARFAHQLPEPSPHQLAHLPPPFTLQPQPQWDESAYNAPFPSSRSSAWSRPTLRSARGRSTSPARSRREYSTMGSSGYAESNIASSDKYYPEDLPPLRHVSPSPHLPPISAPPSRSGRYDAVRATFIPFTTSPTIASASSAPTGGRSGDAEDRDANLNESTHEHEGR